MLVTIDAKKAYFSSCISRLSCLLYYLDCISGRGVAVCKRINIRYVFLPEHLAVASCCLVLADNQWLVFDKFAF